MPTATRPRVLRAPLVIALVDWTPYWTSMAAHHYPAQYAAADAALRYLDAGISEGDGARGAVIVPVASHSLERIAFRRPETRVVLAGTFGKLCVDHVGRALLARHPHLDVWMWEEAIVWSMYDGDRLPSPRLVHTDAVYAACGLREDPTYGWPRYIHTPTPAEVARLAAACANERQECLAA